jgi:diguanylate cyclase (GGDEF)-like protein
MRPGRALDTVRQGSTSERCARILDVRGLVSPQPLPTQLSHPRSQIEAKGHPDREAGTAVKREPIGFRELLDKVLPLDQLAPPGRTQVQKTLETGVTRQLEAAALMAIERLEGRGPRPDVSNGGASPRFEPAESFQIITLELPHPAARDGVLAYPRASLPTRAPADLDQVRRLLRLDIANVLADPRSRDARRALLSQLDLAGRELLAASEVRFFPTPADEFENGETVLDPTLAAEARSRPGTVFYCPDTAASHRLAAAAARGVGALAVTAVVSNDGAPIGHLEARSPAATPFTLEDLARVALLADYCGGVLERATRIEKLVFVDPMTGVYNRSYFELQAQNEMARARREQAPMALCIADIDDFKAFNTTFGYEAGNEVLVQVASALKHGVRPFDTVARWGGEEFAVLLTAPVQPDDVLAISQRLRSTVQRTVVRLQGLDRRSHRVGVTVSIGVSMYPQHAESAEDLWRAANQALLEAKRPPKNQVVFYRPGG